MAHEGITVLEEWFRWAEEWSMLLRIYGGWRGNLPFWKSAVAWDGLPSPCAICWSWPLCRIRDLWLQNGFPEATFRTGPQQFQFHPREYPQYRIQPRRGNPCRPISSFPFDDGSVDLVLPPPCSPICFRKEWNDTFRNRRVFFGRAGAACSVGSSSIITGRGSSGLRDLGARTLISKCLRQYGDLFAAADPKTWNI